MRKLWVLAILCFFSITACENHNDSVLISEFSNTNGCFMQNSNIVEGEKGYYMLVDNDSSCYLEIIDKNTFSSEKLCSKINCNHNTGKVSKDCDALLGSVLLDSINYYKGYIYYIAYSQSTNKCTLCRVSENGSEHEELFEIGVVPDNSSNYVYYVITDQYVYYSLSEINTNNNSTARINKYSFDNKKIDNIYNYEDKSAMIYDMKMCNEWLYFRKSKADGQFNSTLERINIVNNQSEVVAEEVCSYITRSDYIEVWQSFDGVYEYDLQNNKTKKKLELTDETMIGFLATNGEADYVFNMPNVYYRKDSKVFLGNIEGEKVSSKVATKIDQGMYIPMYVGKDCIFINKVGKDGSSYGILKLENNAILEDYSIIN